MNRLKNGDRVIGVTEAFSFQGKRGRVLTASPLYVVFDGPDSTPYAVSNREVIPDGPDSVPMTGAE